MPWGASERHNAGPRINEFSLTRYGSDSHGFRASAPIGLKSSALRVTMIMPCTSAVAATKESRSDWYGRGDRI